MFGLKNIDEVVECKKPENAGHEELSLWLVCSVKPLSPDDEKHDFSDLLKNVSILTQGL